MTQDNEKKQTIETYNKSAVVHAKKFDEIGARTEDTLKTFSFVNKPNPKTVEIGCGNGRDAKEIIKHTNDYLGIDLSKEMIRLAQQNVPDAKFQLADLEKFQFPKGIDVIFSFASLLHSDKESVGEVLKRAYGALNVGGVFFISSKYGHYHKETIDKEGHGPKTYYFYSPEELEKIAPKDLKIIYQIVQNFKGQNWFIVIFQK